MILQLCVVEEVLDIKREDLHKHLVCVATDGASVNVGAHSGICQRLRDEVAPLVDNIKCYAHITQVKAQMTEDSLILELDRSVTC